MPGVPPVTPRWGFPRYSQADDAVFSTDINPIVDLMDGAILPSEFTTEQSVRANADTLEAATRAAADNAEAASRAGADTAETTARRAADTLILLRAATTDDETAPLQSAGSVIGHFSIPFDLTAGEAYSVVGVQHRAMWVDVATPANQSVWQVQSDNGHGDGSLAVVAGLSTIKPGTGRAAITRASAGGVAGTPVALNAGDTVALVLVTPGNTLGFSLGVVIKRTHT